MNVSMDIAVIFRGKRPGTDFTGVGFDAAVRSHMLLAMFRIGKGSVADFAFVRPLSGVDAAYVHFQ